MSESYKEYCTRVNIVPSKELVYIDELEVPISLRRTVSTDNIEVPVCSFCNGTGLIDKGDHYVSCRCVDGYDKTVKDYTKKYGIGCGININISESILGLDL